MRALEKKKQLPPTPPPPPHESSFERTSQPSCEVITVFPVVKALCSSVSSPFVDVQCLLKSSLRFGVSLASAERAQAVTSREGRPQPKKWAEGTSPHPSLLKCSCAQALSTYSFTFPFFCVLLASQLISLPRSLFIPLQLRSSIGCSLSPFPPALLFVSPLTEGMQPLKPASQRPTLTFNNGICVKEEPRSFFFPFPFPPFQSCSFTSSHNNSVVCQR